jgi:hypothetical protein
MKSEDKDKVQRAIDHIEKIMNQLQNEIMEWKQFAKEIQTDEIKKQIISENFIRMDFVLELKDVLNILDPI